MTVEQKLRELILTRYHSVREFSISIDMPNSTLESIFKRGIGNSSVTNVIKICKALKISTDALADGEIITIKPYDSKNISDRFEVKEILDDTKDLLTHSGELTLDGKPISKENVESIIDAMEVGVTIARKKNIITKS